VHKNGQRHADLRNDNAPRVMLGWSNFMGGHDTPDNVVKDRR